MYIIKMYYIYPLLGFISLASLLIITISFCLCCRKISRKILIKKNPPIVLLGEDPREIYSLYPNV